MINVNFCGNDKIFEGLVLSIYTMCKYASEPVNIYVSTADCTDINPDYKPIRSEQISFVEQIAKSFNQENNVIFVDLSETFHKKLINNTRKDYPYSPYVLGRLIYDILPGCPERILYLDVDIVFFGDVAPLYHFDLKGNPIGMAQDQMRAKGYCNAGVMLCDIKAASGPDGLSKTREFCLNKNNFLLDQDALNKVFKGRIEILPNIYNEQRKIRSNTVIRHYCQRITFFPIFHIKKCKPWNWEKFCFYYKNDSKLKIFQEYWAVMAKYEGK